MNFRFTRIRFLLLNTCSFYFDFNIESLQSNNLPALSMVSSYKSMLALKISEMMIYV